MSIAPTKWVPVSGGVRLATFERGQGQPIVMIAGLGASAHDWGPTAERLSALARVITFDNRGAGQSTAPDEPMTLDQLAEDAVAVFEAYGLSSAHVVGHSMGGMIAQILAARHPELVERLVLSGTHVGGRNLIRATPDALAVMTNEETGSREEQARKRYAAFVAPDFLKHHHDTFDSMMEVRIANLLPHYAWLRQLQAAATKSDRVELVRNICAPTLIIHGREDPLVRLGNGEALHKLIPGSEFIVIEGAGHMLSWENPERMVQAIAKFLRL